VTKETTSEKAPTGNVEIIRFSQASGTVIGTITAFADLSRGRVVIGNAYLHEHTSPDISLAKLASAIRGKLPLDDLYALSSSIAEFADTVEKVHATEPSRS
jgi:hypothetical protein